LGLAWPSSVTAQVFPTLGVSADPLEAQLNALETRGHGRVLASPNLICQSGQEAEFLAGGEFPIKFVNYKQKEVIWKKYGILLKVKPKADSSGRMNLKIETEVSSITEIVDGIPSLATNRVSTTFDLKETKTIVLSGLLKDQNTTSQSGLPWLQRIPILGSLFSSEDYIQKRTELLIFVRPEILQETQPEDPRLDTGHLVESEALWKSSN
jgi:pilus assembly protein CpaC